MNWQTYITNEFPALVEFAAGYTGPRRNSLLSQVNRAQETGTLLPRHHISLLPAAAASYCGMDKSTYAPKGYSEADILTHLADALKAHQQYARCDTLYFDFRYVAPDEALYIKCLEHCLKESLLPDGVQVYTWNPVS